MMRVLLDTDIFISYLLRRELATGPVAVILAAIFGERFTILIADALLKEIETVCADGPQLNRRIQPEDTLELINLLKRIGDRVEMPDSATPRIVRDPKDDYLIVLASLGNADVLVTGDRDLLELELPLPFRIMSLSTFLTEIEGD